MNPRILVIGSSNMDIILHTDRIPNAGESLISPHKYRYVPGGKGANAAIAASRLGADVVLCTCLGDDSNAKFLTNAYKKENVDTRYIRFDKTAPTGLAAILLEQKGTNRIIVYPGANLNINAEDIENAFLSYPDAVLLQFEIGKEAVFAATEYAKKQNIPVFVDAGPTQKDLNVSLLKNVEIISPNEVEIKDLTGIDPVNAEKCQQACIKLTQIVKTKYVVLKLSNRGCFIFDGTYCEFIQAHTVNAVDTTAAGDAFTAAMTYEFIKTRDILYSCRYANVVGALTVMKMGAITSLPTTDEVRKFVLENEVKL